MNKESPLLPLVGGLLAAIGASLCCVGPLVLLTLGIGGSWISGLSAFEAYRPLFIGVVVLVLSWAGWKLYRPIESCKEGSICAIPKYRTKYRILFWSILLCSLLLIFSPYLIVWIYQ